MKQITKLKLLLAIPSHKRPDCPTLKMYPEATVFVAESQKADYQSAHDSINLVTHPDDIKGLTPKLNWMIDWAKKEKYEVMVKIDDDFKKGVGLTPFREDATPQEMFNVFESLAILCKDSGTNLFTFLETADVRKYNPAQPMKLFSAIRIGIYGILLDHEQWFDERMILKQDIDFALQTMYNFGHMIVDTRYSFTYYPTMKNAGGCSTYRNVDTERRSMETLRRKWGTDIFRQSKSKSLGNMTFNVSNPMYK